MPQIPNDYYTRLAQIESNNRPYVRATTSSASGLFQFIKSTWESLGGTWGNNPNQAFGGLRPSVQEQNQRVATLTNRNATALERVGIAINNATLYAAHFLGITGAKRILTASPDTPIEQVTTANQRSANPSILRAGSTVGDFLNWLRGKTGDTVPFQNSGTGGAPNTTGNTFGNLLETFQFGIGAGAAAGGGPGAPGILNLFGGSVAEGSQAFVENANDLNPFGWVQDLFSIETGTRVISVVIGIALVIVAIIFFANSTSIKLETPTT